MDDLCKSQESQIFSAALLLDPPILLSTPLECDFSSPDLSSRAAADADENGGGANEDENSDGDDVFLRSPYLPRFNKEKRKNALGNLICLPAAEKKKENLFP